MSIEKKLEITKYISRKVERRMQIKIFNIVIRTIYPIVLIDFVY
jgi:nitrate reductase NapE component